MMGGWAFIMACILFSACTKYDTPTSVSAKAGGLDSTQLKIKRYVLWVNIDGARGSIVQQEVENGNLPTLKSMLLHSKYAWTGLADDHSTLNGKRGNFQEEDPITWSSMLTGMGAPMHKIESYSYTPEFDIDNKPTDKGSASYFPNIAQTLVAKDPSISMSCITPWQNLNRYLGSMQSVITSSGDEATFSELLRQVTKQDYRFTLVSLRGVQDAGRAGGFKAENSQYIDNLRKIDSSLKVILDSINLRPNADYEDWLICITSDHGGTPDGQYGGNSDAERDIFGLFYYPHYSSVEMRGSSMEALRLPGGNSIRALAQDSLAHYNLTPNASLAFEMVMRGSAHPNGSYANGGSWNNNIFGKEKSWRFCRQYSATIIQAYGKLTDQNPVVRKQIDNTFLDARWHTVYSGFSPAEGQREYWTGYDGDIRYKENLALAGVTNDSSAIRLGGAATTSYVGALRIWRRQLDAVTMKRTANMLIIPDEYRDRLVCEWRFDKAHLINDSTVVNLVKGGPAFVFNKAYLPVFVKVANTLSEELENNRIMMENTLVIPQIAYWLLGTGGVESRWEGYNFLKKYTVEEQWRESGTDTTTVNQ